MKNRIIVILLSVALIISCLLSGCKQEDRNAKMDYVPQSNFINYTGSQMIATPEGYYAFKDSFLYYITPDLQENIILCGKPECTHNKKKTPELSEYAECNAFFLNPKIGYYNDNLYISCTDFSNGDHEHDVIYTVSKDGSTKELFYESDQYINGFCIYNDNIYIAETTYQSSGVRKYVKEIPIENSNNAQIIFETDEYPDAGINRIDCFGNVCYFYLDGTEGDSGVKYYGIDLDNKAVDVLYETSNFTAFLYMNEYGTIIEDQELLNNGDISSFSWKSHYYRIKPGDTELEEIDSEDFSLIANMATIKNMDSEYIYFCPPTYGKDKTNEEMQNIYVCNYHGYTMAKIPVAEFDDMIFFVLPGTEQYMFLQVMTTQEGIGNVVYEYYYADKSLFNGGTVELNKVL